MLTAIARQTSSAAAAAATAASGMVARESDSGASDASLNDRSHFERNTWTD